MFLQEEGRLDHGRSWPVHWLGRCCLTRFVFKRLRFGGLFGRISLPKKTHRRFQHRLTARDSRCHRLCHLEFSQHITTHMSSHSTSDSRDTLHLTRHHPIHAQHFTIKPPSTAQVPCSRFASTCSDVSSRPPCFEFFVLEGDISTMSQFESSFLCPT